MKEIEPASAYQHFFEGEYVEAARLYEALIASASTGRQNYWYLGLTYLLQGNEEEAQLTWLLALSQAEPEEVDWWNKELVQVLKTEAERQESLQNFQQSWLTRQAIRELAPTDIDNLLHLLELCIALKTFTASVLAEWQVVEILDQSAPENVNSDLLLQVLQKILALPVINSEIVELLKAALPHIVRSDSLVQTLLIIALKLRYEALEYKLAVELVELCSILAPDDILILRHLSCLYTDDWRYDKGIEVAKQFYEGCDTTALKALGGYLLLRAFLSAGGYWQEVWALKETHESVLAELIAEQPRDLARGLAISLIFATSFFPYLQDKLEVNRYFQNQVAKIVQANLRNCAGQNEDLALTALIRDTRKISRSKVLKIGYIGHTLRKHSVGWLSRWLFKYHNRNAFQIYLYLNSQRIDEFTQTWFVDRVDGCWVGSSRDAIVKQVLTDEIDILVDLDSSTLDSTCEIMALKPAPIQVTWLGMDASGIPAIDYFIADAYVLPENAQNYYQEKIWRLPNAYVAVDGFEIGVPTVRREDLEIPPEAVIYLSSQTGQKRHPETARLQLKILKQVPNSYFLIKSLGNRAVIEQLFTQLALSEEVEPERLRFLPAVADSLEHRANLGIADVVLDTYPYNGATTTLETLWMGIPLVTRVGEQFAARNSYTFLMNVGVTEGIAWTDEEYVEWGVRLGQDLGLRQQVAQKLKASRQTAPLWNAKQFTQEMEKAYQQMWQIYLNNNFP